MAEEKIDNTLGEVKNIMENKREDWVRKMMAQGSKVLADEETSNLGLAKEM